MKAEPIGSQTQYLKVLYWGDPGSGKTTAALGATAFGDVAVYDVEGGMRPEALSAMGVDTERIERLHSFTYDELFADLLKKGNGEGPASVVLDSVTELQKMLLESTAIDAAKKSRMAGKDRKDTQVFLEDRGENTEQMRRVLRRLRDLPAHVAITALSRTDEGPTAKVTGPALTPALQQDVMGFFDLVIAMGIERHNDGNVWYVGTFVESRGRKAKDRLGMMPNLLPDPSMRRLHEYMTGKLTPETDPVMTEYIKNRG